MHAGLSQITEEYATYLQFLSVCFFKTYALNIVSLVIKIIYF